MPYISFEDVEQLATIEQVVEMLGLPTRKTGHQLRCSCPVHRGDERTLAITPGVRSRRGSLGVFFCQSAKEGGDRIALVAHCMEMGQQDAAFFIQSQFGGGTCDSDSNSTVSKNRATVPEKEKAGNNPPFNANLFAQKLAYSDELRGMASEADAASFRVGFYRGHVYVPAVYPSGVIAGWWKLEDGKLVPPKQWLPDSSNVVTLKRA